MNQKVCIVCPKGCMMDYHYEGDKLIVKNNECMRGEKYLDQELTAPKRMLTTTVKVNDGELDVVPVYAEEYVDKDQVFEIVKYLKSIAVQAPINCNDIILEEINGTPVIIKASRDVKRQI